jgi:hypothetical protein
MDNIIYLKPSLQKRQKRRDKRLDEEVIECYRHRPWKQEKCRNTQRQKSNNYDNARTHESIKFMHLATKQFSDNLNPLVRYLQTNTGRPWNKVYSELSRKLKRNTVSGLHVFQHLFDFVSENVWLENKRVYTLKFGRKHELVSRSNWKKFYVHPVTGLLLEAKPRKKNCYA